MIMLYLKWERSTRFDQVVAWIRVQGAEPMNSAPVFHKSGVAWWFFRGHPVNNGGSCSGVALRAILTPLTQPCCWRIYHHYNCCRPQSMLIVYFNMETYYWLDAPRLKPPSVIHISSPYPPVILHFGFIFYNTDGWNGPLCASDNSNVFRLSL